MHRTLLLGRTRYALMLVIFGLLLSAVPATPSLAGVTVDRALDNTLDQFGGGTLQRTSLAQIAKAGDEDLDGGVQLGRIGVLKTWFPTRTPGMPKALLRSSAVAIGNRIYVIGGLSGGARISDVISIQVDQETGALVGEWRTEPALPAAQGSVNATLVDKIAPVSAAGATSVSVGGNRFIFVVGGSVAKGAVTFSSFAVRSGRVNADGSIASWTVLDNARIVPDASQSADYPNVGRESAVVLNTTITTASGDRTFIYALGGLQSRLNGPTVQSQASRSVLYAEVGSDGKLYKPTSNKATEGWEGMPDTIPVIPPSSGSEGYGLFDSAGTIDRYPAYRNATYGITNGATVITMIGGQKTATNRFDSLVYRAVVNEAAEDVTGYRPGELIWLDRVPSGGGAATNFTLTEARSGHTAVAFGGNFYVPGGNPSGTNDPDEVGCTRSDGSCGIVSTSYVNDNLELPTIPGGSSNFVKANALYHPRVFHSTVLVRGAGKSNNGAFVYVIGGRGAGNDPNDLSAREGSQDIIYGKIGESEDQDAGFALDGWYYSKPFELYSSQAVLKEISWRTKIDRTAQPAADIEVDFRTSLDNDCGRPLLLNAAAWQPLDTASGNLRSNNGLNSVSDLTINSRCLQYRARLISGVQSGVAATSPGLLNFNVRIVIPGDADLWPSQVAARFNGEQALTALDVQIRNQNVTNSSEPTLAADVAGGGSFYVLMYIYGPGQTPPATDPIPPSTPIDPNTLLTNSALKLYANVDKSEMQPNQVRSIYSWCVANTEPTCTSVNPITQFKQLGTYTVIIVVDGAGGVQEATPNGKANNAKRITVQVNVPPKIEIRAPLVRK